MTSTGPSTTLRRPTAGRPTAGRPTTGRPTTGRPGLRRADLVGVWHRGLLRRPGTADDSTTEVTWVQGPCHFVDLRQHVVAGTPVAQEGFAGRFELDGDLATWHREIDLDPPGGLPDAGRLTLHRRAQGDLAGTTDLLVEDGVHLPYTEHWWRDASPVDGAVCATGSLAGAGSVCAGSVCAGGLEPSTGQAVVLVRAGSWFGFACGDEVSIGRVEDGAHDRTHHGAALWRVARSSLPRRVGEPLRLDDVRLVAVHGDRALLPRTR